MLAWADDGDTLLSKDRRLRSSSMDVKDDSKDGPPTAEVGVFTALIYPWFPSWEGQPVVSRHPSSGGWVPWLFLTTSHSRGNLGSTEKTLLYRICGRQMGAVETP